MKQIDKSVLGHHHDFSPSSLERRFLCPASYIMEKGLEDESSEEAQEGERLHKAIKEQSLKDLDEDQKDMIKRCMELKTRLSEGANIIELELPLTVITKDGNNLLTGTADFVAVFNNQKVVIIDWKFGYLPVTPTKDNLQLAAYALGAMQRYNVDNAECYTFQPRINRLDKFTFTDKEGILNSIESIIERCKEPKPEVNPSLEACRYCKAKLTCPDVVRTIENSEMLLYDKKELTPKLLSDYYGKWKMIKKIGEALENKIKSFITEHGSCGDYTFLGISAGYGITDTKEAYKKLAYYITFDEYMSLLTPSDVGLKNMFINAYRAKNGGADLITKKEAEDEYYRLMKNLRQSKGTKRQIVLIQQER